jgi:hypothetical protein
MRCSASPMAVGALTAAGSRARRIRASDAFPLRSPRGLG